VQFTQFGVHGRDESVPYAYGIHAAIVYAQPMFTHVHPLWCVIAFIQFGVNGRDKSAPTPTECMLRLLRTPNVYPRTRNIYPRTPNVLPTCTQCREPIHRARIS